MQVPFLKEMRIGAYILKQKLQGRKRYPLVLMLEPLFRCNLACVGCGKIDYPDSILNRRLSVQQCLDAVDECGAPMVAIPGGEPLIHREIGEIVKGLVAKKKFVSLCTNALLLAQAVRAAEAKVQLISPFVGRIYDWYKEHNKRDYAGAEDPGVKSVQEIYSYYKKFDYPTEVMGASFRNVGQIRELAGCDLLTISPELMKELSESFEPVERKLSPEVAKKSDIQRLELDEKKFRYLLNDDAMATEKTAEGIRKFAADIVKLEKFVASKLGK